MEGLTGQHAQPVIGGWCFANLTVTAIDLGDIQASAFTQDHATATDDGELSFVFQSTSAVTVQTYIGGTYASDIIAQFPELTGTFTDSNTGATISNVYRDLTAIKSLMTYDGVTYELADDLNPNLFVTEDPTTHDTLTPTIPTKGSPSSVQITDWTKWTSLTLGNVGSNYENSNINDNFLSYCTGLTSLTFLPSNWKPTTTGEDALYSLEGLTSLSLSSAWNITTIGDGFLAKCKVTSVIIPKTWKVETIGGSFLWRSSVQTLDMSTQTELTSIGSGFLESSTVQTINFPSTWKVTHIGYQFLRCAGSLTSITFPEYNGPSNQKITIENAFMPQTYSIQQLAIPYSWNVEKIDAEFLVGCQNLTQLDMGNVLASQMTLDEYDEQKEQWTSCSLLADNNTVASYTTGITISGKDKHNIVEQYPDIADAQHNDYRHLIEAD